MKVVLKFQNDSQEASTWLDSSFRTTGRLLAKGVEQGLLERLGKGSATRYRFLTSRKAA